MIDNGYSNVPAQIETFDFACQTIAISIERIRHVLVLCDRRSVFIFEPEKRVLSRTALVID